MPEKRLSFDKERKRVDFKLNMVEESELDYDFLDKFKGAFIRSEYLIRDSGNYVTNESVLSDLRRLTTKVSEKFYPNDIWYRVSEFTTPEANALSGVEEIIKEKNEMCGLRGIRRSLKHPEAFKKELKNIGELTDSYPNINFLFTMIHDISQVKEIKNILREIDYNNKIGMMVEIPSAILLFDQFHSEMDNFVIGLNDITAFVLGSHRRLEKIYDRTHPAVKKLLSMITERRDMYKKPIEMAGYLKYPEVKMGIDLGVDSIYLNVQSLPYVFEEFKDCKIKDRPYIKDPKKPTEPGYFKSILGELNEKKS
jgi:phosphoenolpyruvate synthase/pyruvate phosphate dikinase